MTLVPYVLVPPMRWDCAGAVFLGTGAVIGRFDGTEGNGVEGGGESSGLSEDDLDSSDGKRKLAESEDGGVSEDSDESMYLFDTDDSSLLT
jgi:hypothetical protein